jgi:hypothetical protein
MDISKAFNSVNSIMLETYMKQIKLPNNFIELIMDVAYNRFNQVIIGKELSEEYYVNDGIDQGETWSPLLWRIFYDPLLVYLENMKNETGYKLETHKNTMRPIEEKLEIKFNCTSYMDDMTLISYNKDKMLNLVEICHEFFEINDIKANVNKYELIRVNSKDELEINGTKITKVNDELGNRYLGFWFRYDNKRKIYIHRIKEIIDKAVKLLKWKTLTEKQITSIWNMVIIPKIEYQLNGVLLTKNECNNLMKTINKLCKNKGKLASTTPNCIIYDKNIIGLKNIFDVQLEMISKNLLYYANENSELGKVFKIKMRQMQEDYWTANCLGENGQLINFGKNNYIGDALYILKEENFTICDYEIKNENNDHLITIGIIKLEDIFKEKEYQHFRKSLVNKNLLYLEQCIKISEYKILKWKHLVRRNNNEIKGKIPKWYHRLLELTTEDNSTRIINRKYQKIIKANTTNTWSTISSHQYNGVDINTKSVITWNENNNEPIFSKYKKKSNSKNFKHIGVHLIPSTTNNFDSPTLIACNGCNKNIKKKLNNKNECWIYIENKNSRHLDYRKKNSSEGKNIKPYETYTDIIEHNNLLNLIQIDKNVITLDEDDIDIKYNEKIDVIDKYIEGDNKSIKNIKNLLDKIIEIDDWTFEFTIKEMLKYEDNTPTKHHILLLKGTGMIDKENNSVNNTVFEDSWTILNNLENTNLSILYTIIILLILINDNSKVKFISNNNMMMDFMKYRSNSPRRHLDNPYYISLNFILNWISSHNIDFDWIKNEPTFKIDSNFTSTITLGLCNIEQNLYILRWNKRLIFGNYRDWIKKFNQCRYKCNIMTTTNLGDIFYNNVLQEINWKKTFDFIGKGTLIRSRKTNSIDNEIRAYKIKNILKTLLTYEILSERNYSGIPHKYCL